MNPKITVLIPIYNAEAFLKDAIDSVLWQTFTNFELLALDDSSTDNSREIVLSYKDARIKLVECTHNFVNTLNTGLHLAKGKYIALLDHDDIMMPYRLQTQYDFMELHPEIAACGGRAHTFGAYAEQYYIPTEHGKMIEKMLIYSPIINPTGFVRKDILAANNLRYQEEYGFSSDYKLWSEVAKVGRLANIPKTLTLYRTSNTQTSVKFKKECRENGQKVKLEMLEYFLEHIDMDNHIGRMVNDEFIPMIDEIGEHGIFDADIFFQFMYELVVGLRKNKIITV